VKKKIYIGITIVAAIVLISGMTILATASPGTSSDPLITLGYLNGPFRTAINTHVATQITTLTNTLNTRANQVETQVKNTLASNQTQTFVLVTLNNGQTRDLTNGAELMLRGGTATINTGTYVNHTTGTEQTTGALTVNNMYYAAAAGRITATADNTRLLIRG